MRIIIKYDLLKIHRYTIYDAAIIYKSIEKDFNVSGMCRSFPEY